MTQTTRKMSERGPASRDARCVASFVLFGLVVLVAPPNAAARDDLSGPLLSLPNEASAARDLATEVRVRTALKEDEQLRTLNLRIKVAGGIAQLSGPVTSAEVRRRVEQIVERIPGVLKVETGELYLAKARRPAKPLPLPLEGEKPTQTRSASPGALSSAMGTLTGRDSLTPAPTNPSPNPRAAAAQTITLLAPEAVTSPSRVPEPSRLTANPRSPAPVRSLSVSVERLRQTDSRFRKIRTEVDGNTVRIITGDTPGEHVMAFAQALTRVPGVGRIVVRDAASNPR